MNPTELNAIKAKLLQRREELTENLSRLTGDSRDVGEGDVQDEIDRVITSEAKTTALDISTREYESLRDVQAALVRVDDGTYGTCVVCGREIQQARLEAIPETQYCRDDAEQVQENAATVTDNEVSIEPR